MVLIEGNGDWLFVGIGSCSFVKTYLKWPLRAFALLWSVVFKVAIYF